MQNQYDTFVDNPEQLPEGKEIELEVRSLNSGKHKYEIRVVRAIIARDQKTLKGADILKLRLPLGEPVPTTLAIKIVKELS